MGPYLFGNIHCISSIGVCRFVIWIILLFVFVEPWRKRDLNLIESVRTNTGVKRMHSLYDKWV